MADDVAQAAAAALLAEDVAAPEAEQPAPEQTEEAAPEAPDFSYEADTEGIEDLLAEPDPDEYPVEDDDDPEPVLVQTDEYQDPEVAKLIAKNQKLEKQLKFQSELRAKDSLKGWRAEAGRRFPLADIDEIEGTSRRAVLRKAQEQHDRYQRKLEPVLSKLDALRTEVIGEAQAEGRAQAEQSWGRPTVAPQVAESKAAEEQIDPRRFKNLHAATLARLRGGEQSNVTATINDLIGQ